MPVELSCEETGKTLDSESTSCETQGLLCHEVGLHENMDTRNSTTVAKRHEASTGGLSQRLKVAEKKRCVWAHTPESIAALSAETGKSNSTLQDVCVNLLEPFDPS